MQTEKTRVTTGKSRYNSDRGPSLLKSAFKAALMGAPPPWLLIERCCYLHLMHVLLPQHRDWFCCLSNGGMAGPVVET